MLDIEEFKTTKIPGLPRLTNEKLEFIVRTLNGEEPREVYKQVNNIVVLEDGSLSEPIKSSQWMNAVWYKEYQEYYEKLLAERAIVEQGWNLDMSILERRKLYALNYLEVERLAHAHDKAIAYWTKKKLEAIEAGNEKKIDYYEEKIIKEIKSKNMAIASNQACQQSLEGLDKLMGLQTVNIHHTSGINFFGEDMWDDDNVIDGEATEIQEED